MDILICPDEKGLSIKLGRERSGSVVECLTRGRGIVGSRASLRCGPWARHIYPSLVLVQPKKTHPCLTERLLMGCKESNQTNKQIKLGIFSNSTCLALVLGAQKNRLIETVLLSTHNKCYGWSKNMNFLFLCSKCDKGQDISCMPFIQHMV